jgi:hypothetical protein
MPSTRFAMIDNIMASIPWVDVALAVASVMVCLLSRVALQSETI